MLESVLVLGVSLFLIIGILDVSQILFVHQSLVERARSAVRWGVVNSYDPAAIRNMVLYNQPTVTDTTPPALFGMTPGMVSVELRDTNTPQQRIVISITNLPYVSYSPLMAGTYRAWPVVASMAMEAP